jgi:hypothetical protein
MIPGMEIPQQWTSRYDPGERRKSTRKQREKGVTINLPAVVLAEAGIDPNGPPPEYKLWATSKGGVMIRLYTQ